MDLEIMSNYFSPIKNVKWYDEEKWNEYLIIISINKVSWKHILFYYFNPLEAKDE